MQRKHGGLDTEFSNFELHGTDKLNYVSQTKFYDYNYKNVSESGLHWNSVKDKKLDVDYSRLKIYRYYFNPVLHECTHVKSKRIGRREVGSGDKNGDTEKDRYKDKKC